MFADIKTIFDGRIIKLSQETVELPDGRMMTLEIVHHPGGAVIAAIDEKQQVCLIRQHRHAVGDWVWELPAGLLEAGEQPETSARRELQEETGLSALDWRPLGQILSSPGFCDEKLHLFLATSLSHGEASPDENEFIEMHWVPLDQAVDMALQGEIDDAKSVIGLLRANFLLA